MNHETNLVLLLAAASLALALALAGRYSLWRDNPLAAPGESLRPNRRPP